MPVMTSSKELAVGMRLHRSVHDGVQLLLPAGKSLNAADIDFLVRRCPDKNIYVEDPILDKLVTFEDDRHDQEVAVKVQQTLVELMADVQKEYSSRMITSTPDCRGIQEAVKGVLGFLRENPVMALKLIQPKDGDDYLTVHAAHVFYLSLVVGDAVRARVAEARKRSRSLYATGHEELNLTPLALAALLMDIGMLPFKDIFAQPEPLTIEQCELVRNHPIASASALPAGTPEVTKLVIETHHENYDGSGYPYGLKGDEIHILTRILRIADAYAAATSHQVYREACSTVRALWEMTLGPFVQFYDPVILKMFSKLIHPYPIGAKVRLNSGRFGVVVRYGTRSPFLPEIIIAFDEDGKRLPKRELHGPIKLHQHPTLRIVSFRGEDLTDIYAQETTISNVTADEFTTLYESMYTGCAVSTMPRSVSPAR